jgi:hypothetical protein
VPPPEQPWSIRRHKSPIKIYLILVSLAVTRPHRVESM